MTVTKNVIMDLLPLYVAGEVSDNTRSLVDEYLKTDPELARTAHSSGLEGLAPAAAERPSDDVEVRALRRTRSLLRWERNLLAWATGLTLLSFSSVFSLKGGHVEHEFLLGRLPWLMAGLSSIAVSFWVNYLVIRWRLRVTQFR